tara:strand:+ start:894 stop:2240 length:1347 start_codon:yes stop_codon:yes gene_type:complete
MNIDQNQINLINKAKNYFYKIQSLNIDVAKSAFCWLINLPGAPGYFILKNLQKKRVTNIRIFYFNVFKFFFSVSILHNFKILNKVSSKNNFEKLIISWAKKSDFQDNGSYSDQYFKINSSYNPKIMWFLIYSSDTVPKNIDDNIIIFGKEECEKKYDFFYLLKVFFTNIKKLNFSFTKIFHMTSRASHFAEIVSSTVIDIVKLNNFKSILVAYEAQPFQNTVFKEIKEFNKNIKLIGYLHSTQPLPIIFMYKLGAPDLLLVHGSSQIFHLTEYLNWPEEKLRLIPSLRYQKKYLTHYDSNLVLPHALSYEKTLIKQLKNFLKKIENKSLKPLTIKNHPLMKNSENHNIFIKDIEKVLFEYKDRFSNNAQKSISIFFGGTSAILEALENGEKVVHICADAVLESYSESLWPAIKVKKINENVLEYNLSCYGKCISFGDEDKIFEKYCTL